MAHKNGASVFSNLGIAATDENRWCDLPAVATAPVRDTYPVIPGNAATGAKRNRAWTQ